MSKHDNDTAPKPEYKKRDKYKATYRFDPLHDKYPEFVVTGARPSHPKEDPENPDTPLFKRTDREIVIKSDGSTLSFGLDAAEQLANDILGLIPWINEAYELEGSDKVPDPDGRDDEDLEELRVSNHPNPDVGGF